MRSTVRTFAPRARQAAEGADLALALAEGIVAHVLGAGFYPSAISSRAGSGLASRRPIALAMWSICPISSSNWWGCRD